MRALSAAASPEYSAPSPKLETPSRAETPLDGNLSVTPPPNAPALPKKSANYFPYHEALAVKAGIGGTQFNHQQSMFGFDYMFPRFLSPHWEVGADYGDQAGGHIHAGLRWTFKQRDFLRPSLKLEADNQLSSSAGLAGFVSIDQYYLRGSAALDYTFEDPVSVRVEITCLAGTKNTIYNETLGLNYAW